MSDLVFEMMSSGTLNPTHSLVCLNFENFRCLYSDIVPCKVVMGKSNRIEFDNEWNGIELFSSLANRPSLLNTKCKWYFRHTWFTVEHNEVTEPDKKREQSVAC